MKPGLRAFTLAMSIAVPAIACNSSGSTSNTPVQPVAKSPETNPKPKPLPKVAEPKIASAQLGDDCPDSAPLPSEQEPSMGAREKQPEGKRMAKGESEYGYIQPCTQSSMQIEFSGQGDSSSIVIIKAIRLQLENGKTVGTLKSRLPTAWKEGSYQPWNGTIMPNTDLKTSYKLSLPDWSDAEEDSGQPSIGSMFQLEVDISVGGQIKTVTSPKFSQAQPEMMIET